MIVQSAERLNLLSYVLLWGSFPLILYCRKKKHVVVNGSTVVPYDHLVLCVGTQYQVTAPTEADVNHQATNEDIHNSPRRLYEGVVPSNVFTVNDEYDSAVLLYWLETNLLYTEGMVGRWE